MSIDMAKLMIGHRVKLRQGTPIESGKPNRHMVSLWGAGDVPVGSEGVVAPYSEHLLQVHFDGITPKGGYVFGLTDYGINDFIVID